MKHFLDISSLSLQDAHDLIARALFFKHQPHVAPYSGRALANLFYENSTRTRVSFELAAQRLGMQVINLDLMHSSESKGEIVEDTIRNLAAMGIKHFVLRHSQNGLPQIIAQRLEDLHIINAGDGTHAHPSQAMLDMMTISEYKPAFHQLKIAVVGDVKHSRVAHSFQHLAALMGVGDLVMVAPEALQPKTVYYGRQTTSLRDGLEGADVIMALRMQYERMSIDQKRDASTQSHDYTITQASLAFAKPDAMVMHPGPINRGIEIDSEVADGGQSYILKQVQNGVFMRMAIIEALTMAY